MPRDRATIDRIQTMMERAEGRAVRDVARAYNQARRELVAELLERWTMTGPMTPGQAVAQLRRLGLLEQIDSRLRELERETGLILRDVVESSAERGLEAVERELRMLPRELQTDVRPFVRINADMLERFVPVALEDAGLAVRALSSVLKRELQTSLIQGESFPDIVRRLMAADSGAFARGRTSATLAARRMVITAENAAKQEYYGQAHEMIPAVQKQVIAAIGNRTTETCLRAHGQIVDVDQPFRLTGTPRFADEMMHPSFHWNCRTSVAMYHPAFEAGGLTTVDMKTSAQAELRKRREAA